MVENIHATLNLIYLDFLNNSSQLIGPAKVIAGLGLTIGIYLQFQKIQFEGKFEQWMFFMKIIGLYLAIVFYSTFIGLVNAPLNLVTESVKQIAVNDYNSTADIFTTLSNGEPMPESNNDTYNQEISDYMNEANGEEASGDADSEEVYNNTTSTGSMFHYALTSVIFYVLHFLASTALIVLNVIRTFFLIVLTIFGIFIIPISTFPSLEGSVSNWIQKYINVYMWLPVGYILDGILSRVYAFHINNGAQTQGFGEDVANSGLTNLIAICTIISFVAVPTLTNWFITSSTNAMASKVKSKGENASKAIKAVIAKG